MAMRPRILDNQPTNQPANRGDQDSKKGIAGSETGVQAELQFQRQEPHGAERQKGTHPLLGRREAKEPSRAAWESWSSDQSTRSWVLQGVHVKSYLIPIPFDQDMARNPSEMVLTMYSICSSESLRK